MMVTLDAVFLLTFRRLLGLWIIAFCWANCGQYGIRGLTNKWFESYLANRKKFVSINGFTSSTSTVTCGVSQGSFLGPLLFLLYINDLRVAIKHCKVHHFAEDINLLIINKSLIRLNKLLNTDLKNLTNWLNANKISLNVSKKELIIFKPKRKPLDFNMKLKLNGKRLYPTDSVKYLGIKINSKLNWKSLVSKPQAIFINQWLYIK